MTTQERPSFQIPEISWPTEVTPADINKVREYRNQGMSLGASVAGVIKDEGTYILTPLKEVWSTMGKPDPKDWPHALRDIMLAVDVYGNLAARFIGEEKYTFRREPIPTSPELEELITNAFSVDNFLIPTATRLAVREELPFEEALEKQVNTLEEVFTTLSINWEFQEQQIRHLFETGTPLDVIDYLALLEGQKWRGTDYENRPVLTAIERSRQRFHDIYNETQKQI